MNFYRHFALIKYCDYFVSARRSSDLWKSPEYSELQWYKCNYNRLTDFLNMAVYDINLAYL